VVSKRGRGALEKKNHGNRTVIGHYTHYSIRAYDRIFKQITNEDQSYVTPCTFERMHLPTFRRNRLPPRSEDEQ
jgi:hypothetical protein